MFDIRDKIKIGNGVFYQKKKYIVSGIWYDYGGHIMVVDLIKPTEGNFLCFVKHIHDEQIEDIIL
jgi:hypothetical protein